MTPAPREGFAATEPPRRARKSSLEIGVFRGAPAVAKRLVRDTPVWRWYFARERAVYRAFAVAPPPVRAPRLLAEDDDVLVLERLPGDPLATRRSPAAELPPAQLAALAAALDRLSALPFGSAARSGEAGPFDRLSALPFGSAARSGEAGPFDRLSALPFGSAARSGEAGPFDRLSALPFGSAARSSEAGPFDRLSALPFGSAARSGEAGPFDRLSALPFGSAARSGEAGPFDRLSALPFGSAARSGEAGPFDRLSAHRGELPGEPPPPRVRAQLRARLLEDPTAPTWIADGAARCGLPARVVDAIRALPVAFAHGDLLLRNVVADADGGELGFVDWECAGPYPAGWDRALLWTQLGPASRAHLAAPPALCAFALAREIRFLHAFRASDRHPELVRHRADLARLCPP